MKNVEQILRDQIVELEKLIELKDKRITELEKFTSPLVPYNTPINVPNFVMPPSFVGPGNIITIPINACVDGKPHQYPLFWNGTGNPPCQVCGKSINNFNSFDITSHTQGINNVIATPTSTAGDSVQNNLLHLNRSTDSLN